MIIFFPYWLLSCNKLFYPLENLKTGSVIRGRSEPLKRYAGYDVWHSGSCLDVHSKIDNLARAIQTLPTVGQLLQLHNRHITSPPATGFQVPLQCYKSVGYGGCGKKQEQVLITQSHTTLCACLEELHSRIQERHRGDSVKEVQAYSRH